jgi:recombinational DNA repair protein RecT
VTSPSTNSKPDARALILSTTERYSDSIAKLAPRGVNPAHYVETRGILRVAQTGLELGVSCDLLPFGNECQFNPRYNGIIELALNSGCRAIDADVVRDGDYFEYQKGTGAFLKHKAADDMGPITHAYAIAEIKQQSFVFVVLNREQIDATRREFSKSHWKRKNGEIIPLDEIPWYGKKTAVRRLSPMLPKNARFAAALMFADEAEPIPSTDFEVLPPQAALKAAAADGEQEGRAVESAAADVTL